MVLCGEAPERLPGLLGRSRVRIGYVGLVWATEKHSTEAWATVSEFPARQAVGSRYRRGLAEAAAAKGVSASLASLFRERAGILLCYLILFCPGPGPQRVAVVRLDRRPVFCSLLG